MLSVMGDAAELAQAVSAARERLIEFVGRCPQERWTSSPLADDDPRSVAVIVDHVADAYEYLGSFVERLARGEPVEVSSEIVDELNARHSSAVVAPTRDTVVDHLRRSGDRFVALIEPMTEEQLSAGEGRVTITRFAEIAALHTDAHRVELEAALGVPT
jgi:DinB superfamily